MVAASSKTRVLYVTPGGAAGRGGMGRFARYVARAAAERPDGPDLRMLDSYGPGPFWQMPGYFLVASLRLTWLCLTRQIDVVHLHLAMNGSVLRKLVLAVLARWSGRPVLLHVHGSDFHLFADALPPWARRLMVGEMARAARVVAIGTVWRDYLVERLGLPAARVEVIHNGVPLPEPVARRPDGTVCTILSLGQLGPRKGTPELLAALGTLTGRPWRAVIAGDGEVEASRATAAGLGLAERITIPGWVGEAEAKRLLAEADIFVLPSRTEGLPVALLEAMAAGLAVISTPVGAIPGVVHDGQDGVLVPPGSVKELTAALAALLDDASLRERLGQAARQRIIAGFTIEATTRRLFALYGETAGFPPAPSQPGDAA